MKTPAVWLVLILALPPVVIGAAHVAGLPTSGRWLYALTVLFGAAAIVLSGAWQPRTERRDRVEPGDIHRFLDSNVLALGLAIDSVVFLFLALSRTSALLINAAAILWAAIWVPRWIRRFRTRTSVVINRDPATVFGFVSDFRNAPHWFPDLESVEKITPGSIGPGTRFRFRQPTPNGVLEMEDEIVDYEWAHRMTDRVPDGRSNLETLTFEAVPGGTLLSHIFESEMSYGSALSGQIWQRWTMPARMRRMRQAAWARLKQYMESGAELTT